MALNATQRAQVRMYLGYSDVSQGGAPNRLETAMTDLTAAAEVIVADLLVKLAVIDTSLGTVTAATRAGIIEVDNGAVKWESGSSASAGVSRQGRLLVARLSAMFGVTVAADVFGASGSQFGIVGRG